MSGGWPNLKQVLSSWSLPVGIVLLCAGLALLDGQNQSVLPYNRSALESGEVWRAFTGHFIHLGWSHYILNMSGLLAVWFVYGSVMRNRAWLTCFISLAVMISTAFYIFNPDLTQYVGLSGVLYGVLTIAALNVLFDKNIRDQSKFFYFGSLIVLAYVVFRISYEQIYGQIDFSTKATGGNVIVDAHLYGLIFGVIISIFIFRRTWTAHK